ncbi:hypothetical protein BHYA_0037g00130 [Botrytis hyacinthi]|uniref:Uncharacterized protein n=1 Tax=Botrytis hyacinthi TaxID=278943 RepID=A0A4Z1GU23_9HELO|nr:hypothetical protein BHYA_0037g00130 [Botrytis hyacinthi]
MPFLALHIWIRSKMKSLGIDDFLRVGSLVRKTSIFLNAMMVFETEFLELKLVTTLYAVKRGYRHVFYLIPSQVIETVKVNLVAQAFRITSPTLGKLSVGFLMQRILGPHTLRRKWLIHYLDGCA